MANPITQAGVFRGRITEYGLRDTESGAVGVVFHAALDEVWDSESKAWVDWHEYDFEALGTLWVVKKDGTINANPTQALIKFAGWNGDIESIANGLWQPASCQFVVNEEKPNEYHEDTQFRVAFVNEYERVPGAVGNVTPERAKELQSRFGSQFRALAGNANRNAAPVPAAKPKMPSKAAPKKAPSPVKAPAASAVDPNSAFAESAQDDQFPWEVDDKNEMGAGTETGPESSRG